MPDFSQLEIINPNGDVEFIDLAPDTGFVNIGQHPDNNIVIPAPEIAQFHIVLDYRFKPCILTSLSNEYELLINSEPIPVNTPIEILNQDTIEFSGGYTIVFLEGTLVPERIEIPSETAIVPSDISEKQLAKTEFNLPFPDRLDDSILTNLSKTEWQTDVEAPAIYQLTITNGGDIVAAFKINITGLDPNWITITPPQVNLNEGESETVTIAITPPKHPSSRAGTHFFGVIVTSPNYPDHLSQRGASLTINPYYDYTIGEVSPKIQTVSWGNRSGETYLPIINKGNSEARFKVEGEDDEQACSFEFDVPGEDAYLVRQAEVVIPPAETALIPISITPYKRKFIGFGKKAHTFTVTTSHLEKDISPRAVIGQINNKPLIGPFHIILFLLVTIIAGIIIVKPKVREFQVEPEIVRVGEPVELSWQVSAFVSDIEISGVGEVEGKRGSTSDIPTENIKTYVLEANNFLSNILGFLRGKSIPQTVIVIPNPPSIHTFSADDKEILTGEMTTIHWSVANAEKLLLNTNGIEEIIPTEEFVAQRTVVPDEDTIYTLTAKNSSGLDLKSFMVQVSPPYIDIVTFDVQPREITAGDPVTISWEVKGVENIQIAPLSEPLTTGDSTDTIEYPASGSTVYEPKETTDFVLVADNGINEVREIRNVIVKPVQLPPTIEFYSYVPHQLIRGNGGNPETAVTQLTWSVTGDVTYIEIRSPDYGALVNLNKQGVYTVEIDKTTLFTLTAFNGDAHTAEMLEVIVLDPTPTPTPSVTPTP